MFLWKADTEAFAAKVYKEVLFWDGKRNDMQLEFDVKIDTAALYDYMLRHSFNSASGILGSTVGAMGIVVYFMNGYFLYLLMGIIILGYLPVSLYLRAKRQALNPVFKQPLHYTMTEEGVSVSQGETTQFQKWEDMHKAVSTNHSLILYTRRVNASIFPRKDLGELQAEVIGMISTHMQHGKVQIKA